MDQRQQNNETAPDAGGAGTGTLGFEIRHRTVNRRQPNTVADSAHRLFNNAALLPSMIRKPRLIGLWLATARRAQIALGLALLVLVFAPPPALSVVSDRLYPPVFERQNVFERLFEGRRTEANPLREVRYRQFLTGVWILGLSPFLVLLLQHIPVSVRLGRDEAQRLIKSAEQLATTDPERSARLYQTAQGLMLDAEHARASASNPTQVISRAGSPAKTPTRVGTVNRYRVDSAIGSGGMGVVYAGTDTLLKRPVALKQLFSHLVDDTEHSERFRQEALALASLTHPHIVTIYDLIEHNGHFWIIMELLTGGSLADLISSQGGLPVKRCVEITCAIAGGLDYAHERGIVHRDIKPMNVLFSSDGEPKLTDFGNAKLSESVVHTREGLMMGSPAFMSPEQVDGSLIDLRTDIYSLGITLYQMLTGEVPFEGELSSLLAQHVHKPPRPPSELNPTVSAQLDTVLLTMLAKLPSDRYQSCKETIAALLAATV